MHSTIDCWYPDLTAFHLLKECYTDKESRKILVLKLINSEILGKTHFSIMPAVGHRFTRVSKKMFYTYKVLYEYALKLKCRPYYETEYM